MILLFLFWTIILNLQLTTAQNVPHETGIERRIWAEEGGHAVLPCYLSPQMLKSSLTKQYKGLTVRWERYGVSSHKESHLVIEVEASGVKKQARSMMHRVTVWDTGFLSGNFSLHIEPLLTDDAGTYEALVEYGNKVEHCRVELGVVSVTANPPGILVESEPVRLTCNSTHPENPTKRRWLRASQPVHSSGPFCPLDQSLLIYRSSSGDSGPWVCELTFADGEIISAAHNLQVLGFAGPSIPVVYTAAGSDAHLPCMLNYNPIDYGILKVAVHWSFVARGDPETKSTSQYGNERNFGLPLLAVGPDNAGQYFCEITIRGTTITKSTTLAVMTVTPSIEGPVMEGSHLLLTCNLSFLTGHEHFQWKKLDLVPTNKSWPEATSRSVEVLRWGKTLAFSQVSPNDAGTWECSVHGPDGILGSVQHRLEVAGALLASSQPSTNKMAGKITFGLILFLLVLVVSILALALLRRRIYPPNFPTLDRMVSAALPGKTVKDGGQEKVLQAEC
ncbi:lymphocyte activation gene 3 protein [Hemicordylus capensis]|uniref:lymphocyte activation gene 3 protein n=1 Tax=Hemicordylus capensis TaxID=884348 RepID=UPI0023048F5B|nr:lymphocyte activation gene 3 protein [Hemicordylus capensis]